MKKNLSCKKYFQKVEKSRMFYPLKHVGERPSSLPKTTPGVVKTHKNWGCDPRGCENSQKLGL